MKETKRVLFILLTIFSGVIYADKMPSKEDTVQMSYEKLQSQQTVLGTMRMQTSAEYRATVYQVFNSAKNVFLIEKGKNHKY